MSPAAAALLIGAVALWLIDMGIAAWKTVNERLDESNLSGDHRLPDRDTLRLPFLRQLPPRCVHNRVSECELGAIGHYEQGAFDSSDCQKLDKHDAGLLLQSSR
jgi:hypothetical protein